MDDIQPAHVIIVSGALYPPVLRQIPESSDVNRLAFSRRRWERTMLSYG